MAINIKALLALPEKERKKIAEQLWDSLSPAYSVTKEDEATIALLEERWQNIQSGKSKLYSSAEIKDIIKKHRTNK
jgi:putative addiction module component (TIGR02574 family)